MLLRALSALLIAMVIAGCATPTSESIAAQWKGKTISEAIQVLGPPQSSLTMPDDITIYTWEEHYGSSTAAVRGYCRTGLHVNSQGIIVGASQVSRSLLCK